MAAGLKCDGVYTLDWTNFTAEQITEFFVIGKADQIMGYVVLPAIVCFGLLSNMSFLITFARTKWMHSTLYYYLVHLALVDSTVLTLAYAQRLITHLITPFNFTSEAFGEFGCAAILIIEMLYYSSLIIVTTITLERYLAICHPLRHMKGATNSRIIKIFILTWIFSFTAAALQLPHRFKNQLHCIIYPDEIEQIDHDYPRTARICSALVPWYETIYRVLQFLAFYTCLFINIYCYFRIVKSLSKRSVDVGSTRSASSSQASGNKVRDSQTASATRTILVNGSLYFLCNSPINFFMTLSLFLALIGFPLQVDGSFLVPFFTALQVLVYINSAINPIIYSFTNARYRSAVFQTFGCGSRESALTTRSELQILGQV